MFGKLMENMTEAEAQDILNTQLPPELEKQAEQEVAQSLLAEALYNYGYTQGQRLYAECEGEGDLSKVASAEEIQEFEAEENAAREAMDQLFDESGLADVEDPVELEKNAQAVAGILFEGWSDAIEKIAGGKGKEEPGHLEKAKKMLKSVGQKIKKSPGKAALIAGGAGAAGYAAHRLMKKHEKKSSELTAEELIGLASDVTIERLDNLAVIDEGCEKLAGAAKGKAAKSLFAQAKDKAKAGARLGKGYLKRHGKAMGGAAALGAGAGFAAGRASKE